MEYDLITVGTFNVTSGKIIVTDPCYDMDVWCLIKNISAKNGMWKGGIALNPEEGRVSRLMAFHSDYYEQYCTGKWKLVKGDLGVDSGQCSIFDQKFYKKNHGGDYVDPTNKKYKDMPNFYSKCCWATFETKHRSGIVDSSGIVSSSGYGDGSYNLEIIKVKKLAVALHITFIEELSDEDDI